MGRPHVVVIPYPAQGHVMPLMELSHNLVDRGFQITFVNTESVHKKVVSATNNGEHEDFIHLVPIPDGVEIEPTDNLLSKHVKLIAAMGREMPGHFENSINKINDGDDMITCVIADVHVGWALEVAEKLSIPRAAFWPASATMLAVSLYIPNLIEDGIITADGDLVKDQIIQLSPTMPAMKTTDLYWLCLGFPDLQKALFNLIVQNNRAVKLADHLLCNSFYELEPSAFDLIPNLKPIGPLSASSRLAQLWPEDSTCLSWLDQQTNGSVMYVAFGSITVMDKIQFDEVALGLELSGNSFLWVVRPDFTNDVEGLYPEGFQARVGTRGRMIGWAPQREVLAHPSIGGFLTHCGWNSTMEGISNGVPLLCWPYFSDQFLNKTYICDVWKNGLGLKPDADGLISREEIKTKVAGLLKDEGTKANALKLKESATKNVRTQGASSKNFEDFVRAIK